MALSANDCDLVLARLTARNGDTPGYDTWPQEKVPVKQERPDEAEIRELAAKMVEANKAKMLTSIPGVSQRPTGGQQALPGILGYLNKKPNDSTTQQASKSPSVDGKTPLDDDSQRGRFGWITFDKCHIPYIYRSGEKYCAVRILEAKLLNKYLNYLHSDIYSCTCIKSYFITEAESKLFNEINNKHCENQFGKEQFTCKDLVVRLSDAKEFYTFLDVCYTKLTSQNVNTGQKGEKCGFIRINKESVVPYTVKDNLKYVPLFYFEGETDNLKLKAEKLEGWDLSYLKFCCKVQGIRNELFASETCSVISLSDIKSYFPPGTGFEDYWPSKVMDSQLFVSGKGGASAGGWTKQPPAPPAVSKPVAVVNNASSKTVINARTMQSVPRSTTVNTTIHHINQTRPVTTHPGHGSPNTARTPTNAQILNPVPNAVNGWSGLVGEQPTFQTIVPQSNSIIRMQNPSLNMHSPMATSKGYSQQPRSRPNSNAQSGQYPVYPVSTMQNVAQAPPPLVRATAHSNQPNLGYPTYGKDDWMGATYTTSSLVQNAVTASTYPQMLNLSTEQVQALLHPPTSSAIMPHTQRHTPPAHNTSHPKYPPPLIPVNGSSNSTRDSRGRKALIPIAETIASCQVQPYGIQKALVDEKLVPCINFKPYIYSELLMTLPDFVFQFFPNADMNNCREILSDVLGVDLYQGNRLQMKKLMEAGKCTSMNEELPLIQVRNIIKYMPQMKYMFRSMGIPATAHSSEEHPPKKRQRTS
ncbi:uncharacterized protein [Fopius arisanus]|uniref:Uncharacterized protein isoform X2 n=1 Tax=Fopius arisanus TaxID=64838 RepID=A0A9R1TRI2_9HYME|nr:PREDICTED: uncharacterized protein LOC105273560 isoform X2 [Fopius arisanus]